MKSSGLLFSTSRLFDFDEVAGLVVLAGSPERMSPSTEHIVVQTYHIWIAEHQVDVLERRSWPIRFHHIVHLQFGVSHVV